MEIENSPYPPGPSGDPTTDQAVRRVDRVLARGKPDPNPKERIFSRKSKPTELDRQIWDTYVDYAEQVVDQDRWPDAHQEARTSRPR